MRNVFPLILALVIALFSSNSWAQNDNKTTVRVVFSSPEHAEHFMTWMSEQGEQDMYVWMEEAEPELAKMPTYDNENLVIDYSKP